MIKIVGLDLFEHIANFSFLVRQESIDKAKDELFEEVLSIYRYEQTRRPSFEQHLKVVLVPLGIKLYTQTRTTTHSSYVSGRWTVLNSNLILTLQEEVPEDHHFFIEKYVNELNEEREDTYTVFLFPGYRNIWVCESGCDRTILAADVQWFVTATGVDRVACEMCLERLDCMICDSCDRYFNESAQDDICMDCIRNSEEECDRCGSIYPAYYAEDHECLSINIHSYSTRWYSQIKFLTSEHEKVHERTPYFGVEFEVEVSGFPGPDDLAGRVVEGRQDILYCKEDGSISNGFEMVSQPATYNWWNRTDQDNPFFAAIEELKDYNINRECDNVGVHIHMNKNAFTTWHLAKFMNFIYRNREFVFKIAGRGQTEFSYWDKCEDTIIKEAGSKKGSADRYHCINMSGDETLELRMFKSVYNWFALKRYLEFAHSVFEFTKHGSYDGTSNVKNYWEFIKDNHKMYRYLNVFIKRRMHLLDIPQVDIMRIEKPVTPFTNDQLTLFNRRTGRQLGGFPRPAFRGMRLLTNAQMNIRHEQMMNRRGQYPVPEQSDFDSQNEEPMDIPEPEQYGQSRPTIGWVPSSIRHGGEDIPVELRHDLVQAWNHFQQNLINTD